MKNKKLVKIMSILFIMIMLTVTFTNVVLAASAGIDFDPGNIDAKSVDTGKITDLGGKIITVVTTIGSVVSVVVIIVLGIKYMMGSAEEKADYKKTLIPYVIGACLVFAASAVAGIIFGFAQNIG